MNIFYILKKYCNKHYSDKCRYDDMKCADIKCPFLREIQAKLKEDFINEKFR